MYPWQSGSDGREETQRLHLNPRSGRWLPGPLAPPAPRRRSRSPTTSGSTARPPATGDFLHRTAPRCCWRSPGSGPTSPPTTRPRPLRASAASMGPDEYHDGYPGGPAAGPGRQRLHQRDGRLGAAAGRSTCWTALPARRCDGAARPARAARRASWSAGRTSPGGCACRSTPTGSSASSTGYERAGRARLGRLPRALRRHQPARPHPGGRGRQRRTATRCPSRPTS